MLSRATLTRQLTVDIPLMLWRRELSLGVRAAGSVLLVAWQAVARVTSLLIHGDRDALAEQFRPIVTEDPEFHVEPGAGHEGGTAMHFKVRRPSPSS